MNAHERLYQKDGTYRALVTTIEKLDSQRKQKFPDVYRSHKQFQKQMQKERKHLLESDSEFKLRTQATHRARRAIEEYLISLEPAVAELPDHLRKRRIQELAASQKNSPNYLALHAGYAAAVRHLESGWPQLFLTNEQVTEVRKQNRERIRSSPDFQAADRERAAAWRAKEDYLDSWLTKQRRD